MTAWFFDFVVIRGFDEDEFRIAGILGEFEGE